MNTEQCISFLSFSPQLFKGCRGRIQDFLLRGEGCAGIGGTAMGHVPKMLQFWNWKRTENGFTRDTTVAIVIPSPQEGGGGGGGEGGGNTFIWAI